jgi:hypothetical protein
VEDGAFSRPGWVAVDPVRAFVSRLGALAAAKLADRT